MPNVSRIAFVSFQILPMVPKVVGLWQGGVGGANPVSPALLARLAELLHVLMYLHAGFPELYDPIYDLIKVSSLSNWRIDILFVRPSGMTFGPTKSGKLHFFISQIVIYANQKTECFVSHATCTCNVWRNICPAFVWVSDIISRVL